MSDEIVSAELKTEVMTWPERARALRIVDDATFSGAAELLKGIKGLRNQIAATFDPIIKKAHEAHKAALAAKADHDKPLDEAEGVIKCSMTTYHREQERIAAVERARLEAEARRREEEARLAEAAELEEAGEEAEALALLAEPIPAQVVAVTPATPKVAGLSFATTYSAEMVDPGAFFAFLASTPSMHNLGMANGPALNAMARAQREAFAIPGCKLIKKDTPRSAAA